MNWMRIVLDGLAMCVVFNVPTALLWTIRPTAFSQMMPKEIRKAAPKLTRGDLIILVGVLHPMQLLIIVYMALSAVNAGVSGFWTLFWTAYIEMLFVNFGDLIGLDGFFRAYVCKHGLVPPGTEKCEAWGLKKWMLMLALPEHLLGWPLFMCPLAGLVAAGIGWLI